MPYEKITHKDRLSQAGLRPTRQRLRLSEWLFTGEDKHFTAEDLHRDVKGGDEPVSLATVYNTLSAFTQAGLLKTVTVDASRVYYDTNIDSHFHFYDEEGHELSDISSEGVEITGLPNLPEGTDVDRIDIIIRTRKG